ncbi:MAG: hypothetical protein V3T78_03070 [Dehalococcoidia bacterium]
MSTEPYAPITVLEDSSEVLAPRESEAMSHLKEGVRAGRPWCEVLLEAMCMWTIPEEQHNGRMFRYIIQGEAFDWLLLAERMCAVIDGEVPTEEVENLLFNGQLPTQISPKDMKESLGYNKYRGILNFWYGVVVEEALHLAVEDEVRKEMRVGGHVDVEDMSDIAFRRIYDDELSNLIKRFRSQMGYSQRGGFSLTQAKEFNYWLFKLRLEYWDPARVASDTRKGLKRLEQLRGTSSPV